MEHAVRSVATDELKILREGIRNRYNTYHKLDKDRFPLIEYNTNRANYEPLRLSFEEEFYVVRGIDRLDNNLYIPSTNTFALLFSNDGYLPGKKILNTCRSYAEGKAQTTTNDTTIPEPPVGATHNPNIRRLLWLTGLALPVGFVMYAITDYLRAPSAPAKLTISSPSQEQTVPRLLTIEGNVSNADTVWVVVHPVGRGKNHIFSPTRHDYYVQPPIAVDDNGHWRGQIYMGNADKSSIGVRLQIRAFVNPDKAYRVLDEFERYVFHAWPKAELSTKAIEVMRGPNETNR